jgi:transcriptional regulator with XRE-family HTH domain
MKFGERIKKLREERGLSQLELARRMGFKSNSYIFDVENGDFIPSERKLKKFAKALGVPFKTLEDALLESKIEELGIRETELINLFKEIPKLPKEDKKAIIRAYLKIKGKKKKHEHKVSD